MAFDYLRSLNPFSGPYAKTKIVELRIYPIKSCRGIPINSTTLTSQGLDLDRRWMIMDSNPPQTKGEIEKGEKPKHNYFQTIRQIPKMTLINTAFADAAQDSEDGLVKAGDLMLVVSISGQPERRVEIPARPSPDWLAEHTSYERAQVWKAITDAHVYGDEVNQLFREFLGNERLALVYKGAEPRVLQSNAAPHILGREASTGWADMMPVQISNRASIHELNERLSKTSIPTPITIERFRPNIVVEGGEDVNMGAWSEDDWKLVRLNETLELDVATRCLRCQVPNVDPDTAVKDKNQPWVTLTKYRNVDEGNKGKPAFGMLCVPRAEGELKVGMSFEVMKVTSAHKFIPA